MSYTLDANKVNSNNYDVGKVGNSEYLLEFSDISLSIISKTFDKIYTSSIGSGVFEYNFVSKIGYLYD